MVLVNKQQSELPDFYMTFFTAGILAGHSREAQLITLNMAAVYLCELVQIKVSAVKKSLFAFQYQYHNNTIFDSTSKMYYGSVSVAPW